MTLKTYNYPAGLATAIFKVNLVKQESKVPLTETNLIEEVDELEEEDCEDVEDIDIGDQAPNKANLETVSAEKNGPSEQFRGHLDSLRSRNEK